MAGIVAGLVQGRSSWTAAGTLVPIAAGSALLTAFAIVELTRRAPMLDLRRLRHPTFIASLSGGLFTGLALIGLMSYSPTVMHSGLHLSTLASAAVLAIWSATSVVFALAARLLPAGLASRSRLAAGFGLAAVGELALSRLGAGSSWTALAPGLFIAGIGSGLGNAALGRLAVESVAPEQAGVGSGANNTARYLGGAAGVAMVVAVASAGGDHGVALVHGWDHAALLSAVLCGLGALIALACRATPRP
jgi:hypothetical protein